MAFQCSITQGQLFLQVVFKTFISFMFFPLLILWLFRNSKHDILVFFHTFMQNYSTLSIIFIQLHFFILLNRFLYTKLHSFWVKNLVVYVDMYDWSFSHSFPHFSSFPFQVDPHTHTLVIFVPYASFRIRNQAKTKQQHLVICIVAI